MSIFNRIMRVLEEYLISPVPPGLKPPPLRRNASSEQSDPGDLEVIKMARTIADIACARADRLQANLSEERQRWEKAEANAAILRHINAQLSAVLIEAGAPSDPQNAFEMATWAKGVSELRQRREKAERELAASEAKLIEARKALEVIVCGGYANGADTAHPAVGVARRALSQIDAAREAWKGQT